MMGNVSCCLVAQPGRWLSPFSVASPCGMEKQGGAGVKGWHSRSLVGDAQRGFSAVMDPSHSPGNDLARVASFWQG